MTNREMREPSLLLLTALSGGPLHGYALIQAIGELSEGRVQLRPGSLYATLDRLAEEGLVAEAGSETVDGRHRRYYDLTDTGASALAGQVERSRANVDAAAAALRARAARQRAAGLGQGLLGRDAAWAVQA